MKQKHIIIIALAIMIAPMILMGQSINDAKKWYQEGKYEEAKNFFEEAYVSTPNNAEINYWMGTITLKEGDYIKARKYLEFASQKKIVDSYLYLGELYSMLYLFDSAENEFEKYEKAKRRDKDALAVLEEKRDVADKLQKLVNRTEDIQIIDSIVVSKSDFLSAYKLSSSSGSLIPFNKFFNNNVTNSKPMFMTERKDKVYYSQSNPTSGSKLYTMEKLLDNYGNEKPLSESINQEGDQAYPFVMSDGVTIYFASTGHGSIGGYDLFVTRYNFNTNTYLTPNQLNMPFNSPFNDYMMAIDEEKGVGWFASDRFQPEGRVCIYTFIPSSKVVLIESDDSSYIADRAIIRSIKESWDLTKDYSTLIEMSREKSFQEVKTKKDFEFIIDDKNTYYTLSDFKHGGARTLFSQAIDLEDKLDRMKKDLSQKRDIFVDGMQNETLKATILSVENEVRKIQREIESLKFRARNEEIRNNF